LWVTEVIKHKILRVTPKGEISEFVVPSKQVGVLQGIAPGPDGNIWFTSREENMIRRMTPAGEFNGEFKIPSAVPAQGLATPGSRPLGITAGSDGAVWFTEFKANKIGRITRDGKITELSISTPNGQPFCISAGPDGNVWFTLQANRIGRVTLKK